MSKKCEHLGTHQMFTGLWQTQCIACKKIFNAHLDEEDGR